MSTLVEHSNEGQEVGLIYASVIIENDYDVALVRRDSLRPEQVRSIVVPHILMDSGASDLVLTPAMIAALGLDVETEVLVSTPAGVATTRLFSGARATIDGRSRGIPTTIELPGGTQPLFGAIPMEVLGIQLNLSEQSYELLPENGPGTHFII